MRDWTHLLMQFPLVYSLVWRLHNFYSAIDEHNSFWNWIIWCKVFDRVWHYVIIWACLWYLHLSHMHLRYLTEHAQCGYTCTVYFHATANKWTPSQENLSSGSPTKRVSNQSPQLQALARKLTFRLYQDYICFIPKSESWTKALIRLHRCAKLDCACAVRKPPKIGLLAPRPNHLIFIGAMSKQLPVRAPFWHSSYIPDIPYIAIASVSTTIHSYTFTYVSAYFTWPEV